MGSPTILKVPNSSKIVELEVTGVVDFSTLKLGDRFERIDEFDGVYQDNNGRYVYTQRLETEESAGNPGVYNLIPTRTGLVQRPTTPVLESNLDYMTQIDLVSKTNLFFDKAPKIKEMGLIPRRGLLLYGPPGCGKTHQLNNAIARLGDSKTVIYIVALDEIDVSSLICFFRYNPPHPEVERLIVVIEDLGGAEVDPAAMNRISSSGLLSFLDGTQGAWPVPTAIFATTNYPQNFLENLIDRPGRFDEVIEVLPPSMEAITHYMSDLLKRPLTENEVGGLYNGMTTAHAKEAVLRHLIYGDELTVYLDKMRRYSEKAKSGFNKEGKMGL